MKNVLALICFALAVMAFIGLWGTVGALDQDMISLATSAKRSAVFIVILVAAGIGLWRLEREDESPIHNI
ncbi:MAG: hypothetical protein J6U23_11145 [Clostridiales bacterium]|nr:hypothetical protein [Clostridiales bacterium]